MKKEKLSEHNRRLRETKILQFHTNYGDEFDKCVLSGYSIGDLKLKFGISYNLLKHYIKYFNLTDKVHINNKVKIQNVAKINGKKSSKKLYGIPLKPFSDEIIDWYKKSLADGMYKMETMDILKQKFGYGRKKYDQLVRLYGSPNQNNNVGKSNPMYGKSPGDGSGIGIKSSIIYGGKKLYCRSLLELRLLLYLIDDNIKFELSKHRISYKKNNVSRTYHTDITLIDSNTVVEIKPVRLIGHTDNILKFNAAKKYCDKYGLNFDILTENTYDISKINLKYINSCIERGIVVIDNIQYERLRKNLK
jgi:hypothetical protein